MSRRGNGEGSISRRKDGRWWGRYTVHTADGTKQRAVYGRTRAEAAEKLTRAIADRDGGIVYDAGKLTVGAYLDGWLSDSVRDTVRRRTYERYEQLVRIHIAPALGGTTLKNLTPVHVRAVYRSKLDAGLSPRTVQYIHRTLSKALKQAADDGLVPRNAAPRSSPRSPVGRRSGPSPAIRCGRSSRQSPATGSKPSTITTSSLATKWFAYLSPIASVMGCKAKVSWEAP